MTTFAQGQNNSASTQQLANENAKLKQLLADALNKLSNDEDKLKAANELIAAQADETAKAKNTLNLSTMETAALRSAIAADQLAIDAYKRAYDAEQTASKAYEHRALSAETRVDQLNAKVASANKRTLWGTLGGILVGILLKH